MRTQKKIEEIQWLRGVAFLAVVLQHAIAHYSIVPEARFEDGAIMVLLLLAAKFAVPVFIFITGMVLFYNYDQQISYGSFVLKRFQDIAVPYALWSLIYVLVKPDGLEILWKLPQMLLTGKASYHLWYIVMVLQFYLLFPIIRPGVRWLSERIRGWRGVAVLIGLGLLYIGLTTQVSTIGQWMKAWQVPVLTDWFTVYADRNFIFYFFYFALGAAAGLHVQQWRDFVLKFKAVYWTTFLLLFGYFSYISVANLEQGGELHINFNHLFLVKPLMAVFLISSILVFYQLAIFGSGRDRLKMTRMMVALGCYSYGAYLAHALMLKVSYWFDAWFFAGWSVVIRILASFAISAGLSFLTMYCISMIPLGKWFGGVSSRKRKIASSGQTLTSS